MYKRWRNRNEIKEGIKEKQWMVGYERNMGIN